MPIVLAVRLRPAPAWLGALLLLAACSPPADSRDAGDVRDPGAREDAGDVPGDGLVLEGDGGTCDPAACAATCADIGFPVGTCTPEGACSCSGGGADADAPVDGLGAEDADEDPGGADDGGGEEDVDDRAEARDDAWAIPPGTRCAESSYIWIANSAEGTLSKLCTLDGVETARYYTSPQEAGGDPSRTSVNLHGDMVVTNRSPTTGASSVTKFAAEPEGCSDRNDDGDIDTSTGGTDVRPWGEDECMIWNTTLPDEGATMAIGARATAWDGTEDPATGRGGFVWVGAQVNGGVYKLDGETGEVVERTVVTNQPYGGAMDGLGNFWIVGSFCTVGVCNLARVNTGTLAVDMFRVPCGYGISVDAFDRVWTSGKTMLASCVNRLDPSTGENVTYNSRGLDDFYRGIAVDNRGSVWVANTKGTIVQVREADVGFVGEYPGGPEAVVGVAIDYHDYVWAVSQGGNAALRMDPETHAVESFPVGTGPYTYSDMTGFQLRTVIMY